MKITSNIPQAADEHFDDLEKTVRQIVIDSARRTGIRGEARAKQIIEQESYDTGEGLRSVTHEVTILADTVNLHVFAAAAHMYWVEHGRKAGKWPNLDELTKWVGRKLQEQGIATRVNITFDELKALARTGGKKANAQQNAYRQHLSALYVIGRAIATRGIKEKRIFARLEGELLAFFRADLQKALNSL